MVFFFFNDTATTEIYTLSLHDALPISTACSTWSSRCWIAWPRREVRAHRLPDHLRRPDRHGPRGPLPLRGRRRGRPRVRDRKSTRLNSSHANISYAVFCLKKKNTTVIS